MKSKLPLVLLVLAAFLLCFRNVWAADNFTTQETPSAITANSTSSSVGFTLGPAIGAAAVLVTSSPLSSSQAYVQCSKAAEAVTATVPGAGSLSTPINPGTQVLLHKGQGSQNCAAITASGGAATILFTAGFGF